MRTGCAKCGKPVVKTCECPLRHQQCEAGHHWHRDAHTGFMRIDKDGPGACVVPTPREDPGRFVKAMLRDASRRVVDAVLADMGERAGIGPVMASLEPEVAGRLRLDLEWLVGRVLRGGRVQRKKTAAVDHQEIAK